MKNGRILGFLDAAKMNHPFINPKGWDISPYFGSGVLHHGRWPLSPRLRTGLNPMALAKITLQNFRNRADSALGDTRHFNLLIGDNGAGKTNVLEAISLLAPGRGLRRRLGSGKLMSQPGISSAN